MCWILERKTSQENKKKQKASTSELEVYGGKTFTGELEI